MLASFCYRCFDIVILRDRQVPERRRSRWLLYSLAMLVLAGIATILGLRDEDIVWLVLAALYYGVTVWMWITAVRL